EYRFAEYINIILASLDPHTRWTPPVNAKPQVENFGKRYYGIGVALEDINGRTYFNKVVTGGTAYASGKIRENDELLQVGNSEGDMADVSGLNVIEIAQFIRGDKNSDIWITVKYPEGGIETIQLKRDEIADKEVRARSAVINRESGKIGYINLSRFYSTGEMMTGDLSCSADMKKEIEKLKKEAVKGIIVDLRNNPGGDYAQALQIIGLFLPGGPVAHLKAGDKISTNALPADNVPVYDGPLAVMINGRSASASELFSAAMQDYGRGLLIGSNTYGKGTAQSTFPIGRVDIKTPNSPALDLGSLVITHSKFYRSSGASTQLKGVKPDIELPSVFARGYASESNQPSALPWDEIPVTAVKKVQEPQTIESLKQAVELQLGRSQELKQVRLKLDSIRKDNESNWSLNWDTFMQQWQQRRTRVNDLNLLLRLPAAKQMNISPSGAEDDTIEKWRKGLCGDLYLSEAVQGMEVMISRL
ncbi:MAG: carboxy terminal-processing peptidase, partial [Pseudobacter sp.]|uniref:carboxy terminal-processing peptidase n=1 Tax=Pseudobacter sp. TaxID=2045420 RepID=UPI003F7F70D8